MLEITDSAVDVIKQVRAQNDLPTSAALRLEMVREEEQEGIRFSFTGGPQEGDQTISEREDLAVYLDANLADPLSDAILDTRDTGSGIELELRDRHPHTHEGHDHHEHEGHEH